MQAALKTILAKSRAILRRMFGGPQALAFLPALALAAFWLGGEPALIVAALGLPLIYVGAGGFTETVPHAVIAGADPELVDVRAAVDIANGALTRAREANLSTACILIEIDGLDTVAQRSGDAVADALRSLTLSRLRNMLRGDDSAVRLGDSRYMVVLAPSMRLDLEALLQLSSRIQTGLEEPAAVDNSMRYLSASLGFCASTRLAKTIDGSDLLEASQIALTEAIANGPSAIRAWSDHMRAAHSDQKSLLAQVAKALANGQIQPWFQPQICTSTGRVTGMEALARWIHPERGIVPPAQFLRCLEDVGQMDRLGEVILQHSLTALRSWDKAGIDVPRVSVNFCDTELRNPRLVEKIQWELDRFGLTAQRLGIEVLETVIASETDGIVARNIMGLAQIGCHMDLDDFGTGYASINALRSFKVHRLKIDRSFVSRVDRDEDQRRMLAAVLSMADRLGLETLAEGVETVGEHALLAQLGCDHVQGFGIARPMPGDQVVGWVRTHQSKIEDAQRLGRNAG